MPNFVPGLVSIVTPAYNAEAVLAEAVASAQAQTYANWEMLLVDDKSTDGTLALARRLAAQDPRLVVLARPVNGGCPAAKNDAIRAARGQFLAFLDSDDLWLPHKLQTQLSFMRQNGAGLCFSSYQPFTTPGNLLVPVKAPLRVSYKDMLKRNRMGCPTVIIDRFQHPDVPMSTFDAEDYTCWLRLLREGGCAHGIQEVLALYRLSPNQLSGKKTRSARWVWRIYRQEERLTLLMSLWYFALFSASLIKHRLLSYLPSRQRSSPAANIGQTYPNNASS